MELPMEYNPSVSHRELQKNYEIMPHSPMELPTEYNLSVSHSELQKNYGIVPHSLTGLPMELPTYNTDEITYGLRTSRSARMSDMCPSAHIPTAILPSITDGITDEFTHFPKRTHV